MTASLSRRARQAVGLILAGVAGSALWRTAWPMGPAPAEPPAGATAGAGGAYAGSASCRACHERFYKLWETSHHGLAMQPLTPKFAAAELTAQQGPVRIGKTAYRAEFGDGGGVVREQSPQGEKAWPIAHVMGGKNVYYFLAPMERGRLQVLPIAYDVRAKKWYDTAASGVRHFHDRPADAPLPWTDSAYTFNTSCHSCHVSQLSTNYDLKTDSYRTRWAEPGINCETCHASAVEHVRVCRAAEKGKPPKDLKIISAKRFTPAQHNATCAPCHAKMSPVSSSFRPGDRYFDHYDLVTLEHQDFYPDGRDLGENYTYTSWRMSPCVQSGKLHCVHCHTSSGRYRFAGEKTNQACAPCHQARVDDPDPHTHHKLAKKGTPRCVNCHMPMTSFARMRRSDHSMLPPAPAAAAACKSPLACTLCHKDEDAAWADKQVRKWHKDDYQGPVLHRAGLVTAARKRDWRCLPEMLAYITSRDRDEVFATSLIRLLAGCDDGRKWPALLTALSDRSPLVRSAAAAGLAGHLAPPYRGALLKATEDEFRLVRIRAASSLAPYPGRLLTAADQRRLQFATAELIASLRCRPDDWTSHYNLGNYYMDREKLPEALASYKTASRIRPDTVMPLVNASMAYARLGKSGEAEVALRRALRIRPNCAAAHYNLALLVAEKGYTGQAEQHLRAALKTDPNLPGAAYNLGVLLGRGRPKEAIGWLRKAVKLAPDQPRYAYTLAFYLDRSGETNGAADVLRSLIARQPGYLDAYLLLGAVHERQRKIDDAKVVYRKALSVPRLSARVRAAIEGRLRALSRK